MGTRWRSAQATGSARLGRELSLLGVRAAHDQRESCKRGIVVSQAVLADDRVEAALLSKMTELHIRNVVGCRTLAIGDFEDLGGRGVEKFRVRINEALDEPGGRRCDRLQAVHA